MEGVNLFRWGPEATPCLGPHRGCYLRRILGGNCYDAHYGSNSPPPASGTHSSSLGAPPSWRPQGRLEAGAPSKTALPCGCIAVQVFQTRVRIIRLGIRMAQLEV